MTMGGSNAYDGAGIEILDVEFGKVSHANTFFKSRYVCLFGVSGKEQTTAQRILISI